MDFKCKKGSYIFKYLETTIFYIKKIPFLKCTNVNLTYPKPMHYDVACLRK